MVDIISLLLNQYATLNQVQRGCRMRGEDGLCRRFIGFANMVSRVTDVDIDV